MRTALVLTFYLFHYYLPFCNSLQYFLIRRAELIVRYFARHNPFDIVMFQFLWFSFGDGGVEQREMYRQVGIFVDNIHKHITDEQSHGKLFLTLTNERLFLRLARLHLATNKLPQKPSRLVRRPLADHEFIFVPYQGCYYFYHRSIVFFFYVNKRLWGLFYTKCFEAYRFIVKCCFPKNIGMCFNTILKIQPVFFSTNSCKVLRVFP